MTYKEYMEYARRFLKEHGIQEYESDAAILLFDAYDMDYSKYFIHMNDTAPCEPRLEQYLRLRADNVPVQYITGKAPFMGHIFSVNESVLIPRFDTEVLVSEAFKMIKAGDRVLDMCTGSGCIAVSIKKQLEAADVTAVDISADALTVAKNNASELGAEVSFVQSNLFENVIEKFDVIVSNPPYIESEEIERLDEEVKNKEPRLALDGGADGLDFYRIISRKSVTHLNPGGRLLFEIGYNQGEALTNIMQSDGYKDVRIIKDLAGLNRVATGHL